MKARDNCGSLLFLLLKLVWTLRTVGFCWNFEWIFKRLFKHETKKEFGLSITLGTYIQET